MAKIVTLKNKDGDELYPMTTWDAVNEGSSGGDWHCIAGVVATAATTSMVCQLPTQYDCYQIIGSLEFDSGVSNTWLDFRFLNNGNTIATSLLREFRNDQTLTVSTFADRAWQMNMEACNAWDTVNVNLTSYAARRGSNFRKYQGEITMQGSSWKYSRCTGRFQNSTEPTAVQLIGGGNFQAGGYIKVFACNKPSAS